MKKILQKAFLFLTNWKTIYALGLIVLIQLYPVAVSDGQSIIQRIKNFAYEPTENEIEGIDISHHNAKIDWKKLTNTKKNTKKIQFCFIKATEGGDFVDTQFHKNWQEAHEVKLPKGAYHFYRPATNPGLQAQNYINNVQLDKGDYAPVLDFEVQGYNKKAHRNLTKNVQLWLQIIEKHYGIKPIIYTNRFMYKKYIKGKLDDYPLWVSQYETNQLQGFEEAKVIFWQHSQTGKTHGINGDVDFNVFLGSYLDLLTIRIGDSHVTKAQNSR